MYIQIYVFIKKYETPVIIISVSPVTIQRNDIYRSNGIQPCTIANYTVLIFLRIKVSRTIIFIHF